MKNIMPTRKDLARDVQCGPISKRHWTTIVETVVVLAAMDSMHAEAVLENAVAFLALSQHRQGTEGATPPDPHTAAFAAVGLTA